MPDTSETVDLGKFERAAFGSMISSGGGNHLSDALVAMVRSVVNEGTDPRFVPESALERMNYHPAVYLAQRVVTGIIRRKDLYSVDHKDPAKRKEVEEWLWPLLPRVLQAAARAFVYGARGVVFNWTRETIRFDVPTKDGKKTRSKSLPGHTHYSSAHTIRRSHFEVEFAGDELESLHYNGESYGPDRAFVFVWDPEDEADTRGNGASRRAWRDYCEEAIICQLEAAYLERSVDSPRVAFAPSGSIESPDGTKQTIPDFVTSLLMALNGGGAVTFPQKFDKDGNKLYELATLDLPDREGVWSEAIRRREARIFMAYLALMGDGAAASAKTLDGLLKEIVQDIAEWVSELLTEIVATVHARNYTAEEPPPGIVATDVGKASAKKILAEVLRMVSGDELARWVDVSKALDRLGVPVHESPQEQESQDPLGRPKDLSGDRDERRDDAITEEGEDATGAEGEGEPQ